MRYLKPRILALLLMLIVGVGVDNYIRTEPEPGIGIGRNCFGCTTWRCEVVRVADHPIDFLRATWIRLTD